MNIRDVLSKIFLLSFLILIVGCSNNNIADRAKNNMEDKSDAKRILMVIAPQDFKDVEYSVTRQKLEEYGVEVEVASIQTGTAIGVDGMEVKVEKTVSEVSPRDYDAVTFIGGPGMEQITNDDTLQLIAQKFQEDNKFVSAICIAPVILANAGILKNKDATVFSDGEQQLEQAGAQLKEEPVVADGKVITANGPNAAEEFSQTLAEKLNK